MIKRDDYFDSSMDNTSPVPSSSSSSSTKQYGRVNRIVLDKNSDEYKKRRERNNMAVKKSRTKSKMKTQQTVQRVGELKAENERLETRVKILSKELSFLKDLFLAHAGSAHNGQIGINFYGSHDNDDGMKAPINSNIISSTGLNSTSIECNPAHEDNNTNKSLRLKTDDEDDWMRAVSFSRFAIIFISWTLIDKTTLMLFLTYTQHSFLTLFVLNLHVCFRNGDWDCFVFYKKVISVVIQKQYKPQFEQHFKLIIKTTRIIF